MQVFKYYFKLAWSMRGMMMIFIGTFIFAAIAMMSQIPNGRSDFEVQKPKVAVFNQDDSTFSKGLSDYLANTTTPVTVKDSDVARKEAVYFQTVDAIFVIPPHFGDDFFAGKKPQVEMTRGTGQGAMQASTLVSNYTRLAEPRLIAGMDQGAVVAGIKDDISKQIVVTTKSRDNLNEVGKTMYFMNTMAYVFLGLNIMVISTIMLLFSRDMIRKRNLVSGLSQGSVTGQLFAGNAVFTLIIWAIFMVVATILYPRSLLTMYGLLYAIGALLFSLAALGIGFMVGTFVKNRRAIPGITNVVALGMSFLCGIFVPQEHLSGGVLAVAKSLPAYWFIHANGLIAKLTDFSWNSLQPILTDWLILLAFVMGLFAITLIVARTRKQA